MGNARKETATTSRTRQVQSKPDWKRNEKGRPPGKQSNYKTQNSYKEKEKAARLQKVENRNAARAQKSAEAEAERERIQKEKEERIRNYKKKRLEKTKAISKKTSRGQPLMKDRMLLLLNQIQEMKRS